MLAMRVAHSSCYTPDCLPLSSVQLLIGLGEECRGGRACANEDPIPMHTKMAQIGLSRLFFFKGTCIWEVSKGLESRHSRCGVSVTPMFYMQVWNFQRTNKCILKMRMWGQK